MQVIALNAAAARSGGNNLYFKTNSITLAVAVSRST
jgi:hypothetical protein